MQLHRRNLPECYRCGRQVTESSQRKAVKRALDTSPRRKSRDPENFGVHKPETQFGAVRSICPPPPRSHVAEAETTGGYGVVPHRAPAGSWCCISHRGSHRKPQDKSRGLGDHNAVHLGMLAKLSPHRRRHHIGDTGQYRQGLFP